MNSSIAILSGAALIAVAILVAFRWEVALSAGQPRVVRLDRWTGTVTACNADPYEAKDAAQNHSAVKLDLCRAVTVKRLPRLRDPIALAKLIGDITTGQVGVLVPDVRKVTLRK